MRHVKKMIGKESKLMHPDHISIENDRKQKKRGGLYGSKIGKLNSK